MLGSDALHTALYTFPGLIPGQSLWTAIQFVIVTVAIVHTVLIRSESLVLLLGSNAPLSGHEGSATAQRLAEVALQITEPLRIFLHFHSAHPLVSIHLAALHQVLLQQRPFLCVELPRTEHRIQLRPFLSGSVHLHFPPPRLQMTLQQMQCVQSQRLQFLVLELQSG